MKGGSVGDEPAGVPLVVSAVVDDGADDLGASVEAVACSAAGAGDGVFPDGDGSVVLVAGGGSAPLVSAPRLPEAFTLEDVMVAR